MRWLNVLRRWTSSRVAVQVPDAWSGLDDAVAASDGADSASASADERVIYVGPGAGAFQRRYVGNDIHTAKYNVLTFVPVFLFTMFSRVAYLYFLSQCALAYWSTVSPFTPYGPTIALSFVLVVAAIKAIAEDYKRHLEDYKTNGSTAHVVREDGSVADVRWKDVAVGQLLEVREGEDFPADLLCLATTRPDGVAYIRTTSLDGETNLKIRRPASLGPEVAGSAAAARQLTGVLRCEAPNADLHAFVGRLTHRPPGSASPQVVGLSMEAMLLRGCTLQNTPAVYGLAVYTGPEARIQKNAAAPPRKLGSYDGFLNIQILLLLIGQVLLCLGCAVGSYAWRQQHGNQRYFLATESSAQSNYQNGWAYVGVLFLTFWILYSYMIPISLFVTMEIIKFILSAIFITFDPDLKDPHRPEHPRARNSDIVEDLGLVDYVFCDKTGTLTSNEMQLRLFTVKGQPFGHAGFQLEEQAVGDAGNLRVFDPRLAEAAEQLEAAGLVPALVRAGGSGAEALALGSQDGLPGAGGREGGRLLLGQHLLDFWTALCACHSLITEERGAGPPAYQGASPDEVALVEAGRRLGFEFVSRARQDVTLKLRGHTVTHRILDTMDFTSQRARMSVVSRAPDGSLRLYSKGADSVMLPRLRAGQPAGLLEGAHAALRQFSIQGLRTLLICSRVLSPQEWEAYSSARQAAAARMHGREEALEAAADALEQGYELLGVTAIEDKLQAGVPEAIQTLLAAGIKVWMITGDKQETAINIGSSCGLIEAPEHVLLCNAPGGREAARDRLAQLLARAEKGQGSELVVDGKTLGQLLGHDASEVALAQLAVACRSVVVCRASPSQKAAVVLLMKRYHALLEAGEARRGLAGAWQRAALWLQLSLKGKHAGSSKRMLAIGDGANDVAMIQAAHLGVGILGYEGRQAANNSDFSVSQFRFLVRLLFVHGSLTVYRMARLIKYAFYKNVAFAFMLFFFQIYCGFSGQALVDGITASFYNAFFTALPIGAFAIWDRPVRDAALLIQHPRTYRACGRLSMGSFWKTGVLQGILHGAAVFFVPYYAVAPRGVKTNDDVYSVGKTMFIAIIGVVSWEIALISRYWTKLFTLVWALSYALTFPFLVVAALFYQAFDKPDVSQYGVGIYLLGSPYFWLSIFLVYALTLSARVAERAAHAIWRPSDVEILAEHERLLERRGRRQPEAGAVEMQAVG